MTSVLAGSSSGGGVSWTLRTRTMHSFAALVLFLMHAVHATSASAAPLASTNLRIYGAPLVVRHRTPHVYPAAISSPGSSYLSAAAEAAAVKRSAHFLYPDSHRASAPRANILQALDDHAFPWALQTSSPGLLSAQSAAEAALSRTLFFDDYPHQRALGAYISFRREQGLPDIRLGSIRFSSPFLLAL
ncbi:uncharacterized protein [Hetaerina americana]|uniref:uncharacterized protein n=1 Tax=Hetaerina americana TaxID=62018 RepID=UPI003A7F24C6